MSNFTPVVALSRTPTMLLTPLDWAVESQSLAAEYAGLPESKEFLVAARRFMALAARLEFLETQLLETKTELSF